MEFPCIHPAKQTHPYQYAYGLSVTADCRLKMNQIWNSIVKGDLATKMKLEWTQDGCYPSPPVFLAPPHSAGTMMEYRTVLTNLYEIDEEDAGVIMSVVLDSRTEK
jgi:carotenoid cleavage dioxygenase-like enzyme